MPLIETNVVDDIATLTLNNPSRRNALSEALLQELAAAMHGVASQRVRVAILRAPAECKVWSAGHDVTELPEGGHDPLGWQDPLRMIIREIENFPAPVMALVSGSVWGGACELVFACDMIIATPEATFAATPAKLGVPYNATGLLTFLNTVPPHIAKELLFSARPMPAARLETHGAINHVVPIGQIEAFTQELAHAVARNSPLAIGVMKEQLRILAAAHALSPQDFERVQGLRRVVYNSRDYREGIRAFKEKRQPDYLGE